MEMLSDGTAPNVTKRYRGSIDEAAQARASKHGRHRCGLKLLGFTVIFGRHVVMRCPYTPVPELLKPITAERTSVPLAWSRPHERGLHLGSDHAEPRRARDGR